MQSLERMRLRRRSRSTLLQAWGGVAQSCSWHRHGGLFFYRNLARPVAGGQREVSAIRLGVLQRKQSIRPPHIRRVGGWTDKLCFRRVHQGHQLLHFGHDPALFGEGHGSPSSASSRPTTSATKSWNPQPMPSVICSTFASRSRNCGYRSRASPRNRAASSSSADSTLL